jgi:hypothetical protein
MQDRPNCGHCRFTCDAPNCGTALHTPLRVWTEAVKAAHEAGWRTETIKRGSEWRHFCSSHN